MKNLKKGQVLEVWFLDHSHGGKDVEPVKCRVFGELDYIGDKYIRVNSWCSGGHDASEYESFCIIKSCVEKIIVWIEGIVA